MAFFSRQLKDRETRYTATEIECLAVVEALRHFGVYLIGRHFVLETDHQALSGLLSPRCSNKRLNRWALQLQEHDFTARYKPGKMNGNADGLSRQAWQGEEDGCDRKNWDDKSREKSVCSPLEASTRTSNSRRGRCGEDIPQEGLGVTRQPRAEGGATRPEAPG